MTIDLNISTEELTNLYNTEASKEVGLRNEHIVESLAALLTRRVENEMKSDPTHVLIKGVIQVPGGASKKDVADQFIDWISTKPDFAFAGGIS